MHPFSGQKIDELQQIKGLIYWRKSSDVRFSVEKNIFGKKQYHKEIFHQGITFKYPLNSDERRIFKLRINERQNLHATYQTMLDKTKTSTLEKNYIQLDDKPYIVLNPGEYATSFSSSEKKILLTRLSKRSIIVGIYDDKKSQGLLAHIDDFTDWTKLNTLLRQFSNQDTKVHLIAPSSAQESIRLDLFALFQMAGFKFQTLDFSEPKQTMVSTIGLDLQKGEVFIPVLGSSSIHLSPPRKDASMAELICAYTGNKPKLAETSIFKTPKSSANNWAYCCDIDSRFFQLDIY